MKVRYDHVCSVDMYVVSLLLQKSLSVFKCFGFFGCVCVVFLVFLGLCFVFCYFLCLFEYFESFLGLCVFAVVLFVFLGLLVVFELVVYSEEKQFYPR